jgi:two-component system response regulator (stage 0 sporulation protein F)
MLFQKQNLLIVDDNIGLQLLLYELFSEEGFNVSLASNGKEAVRMVCTNEYSLVLVDMKMPVMNGLEAVIHFKKINPDLPVIVMTAYIELQTVIEAQRNGLIRYYINKPFDINEIRNLVKNVLLEQKKTNLRSLRLYNKLLI